jgi:hypothetical protein
LIETLQVSPTPWRSNGSISNYREVDKTAGFDNLALLNTGVKCAIIESGMAKKIRQRRESRQKAFWPDLTSLAFIFGLLIAIAATMMAVSNSTELRKRAADCGDHCPVASTSATLAPTGTPLPPTNTPLPRLAVTPTIAEPDPMGSGRQIILTVSSFTENGLSSDKPVICGRSEPGARITVSLFPDGLNGELTADNTGGWCFSSPKSLTPGVKNLSVVAKKDIGQGSVKQEFTVIEAKHINPFTIVLIIMVIAALGFGGYVYYKSKKQ